MSLAVTSSLKLDPHGLSYKFRFVNNVSTVFSVAFVYTTRAFQMGISQSFSETHVSFEHVLVAEQ